MGKHTATLEGEFGPEFERTLCKLLTCDIDFAESVADAIKPDLLSNAINKAIVDAFSLLLRRYGEPPTTQTLLSELHRRQNVHAKTNEAKAEVYRKAGVRVRKFSKEGIVDETEVAYVRDNLATFVTNQNTKAALLNAVDLLDLGDYEGIAHAIMEATQSGKTHIAPSLGLEFTDFDEKMAAYKAREESRVKSPVGIPILDNIIRGGLEAGKVGMIVAPTGRGKTMMLIGIGAMALLRGLNVVHITLEIDEKETAIRYDARLLGYPINEIKSNLDRYEKKILASTKKLRSRLFIKEWGSDEASLLDVRTYLKLIRDKTEAPPDVVILDYADLLRAANTKLEYRFQLRDIMRGVRQIARDFNCACWTASQVNKEGFDQEIITKRTISESSEKINIADVTFGLCQTPEEERKSKMRIVVMKNRQGGGAGTLVDCIVKSDTHTISEARVQATEAGIRRPGTNSRYTKPKRSTK